MHTAPCLLSTKTVYSDLITKVGENVQLNTIGLILYISDFTNPPEVVQLIAGR